MTDICQDIREWRTETSRTRANEHLHGRERRSVLAQNQTESLTASTTHAIAFDRRRMKCLRCIGPQKDRRWRESFLNRIRIFREPSDDHHIPSPNLAFCPDAVTCLAPMQMGKSHEDSSMDQDEGIV